MVVLGAGQGTRMLSDQPKILFPFLGVPTIDRILQVCQQLNPQSLQLVVRYQSQQVIDHVSPIFPEVQFVLQDEIPGTGRAVDCAVTQLIENEKCKIEKNSETGSAPAAADTTATTTDHSSKIDLGQLSSIAAPAFTRLGALPLSRALIPQIPTPRRQAARVRPSFRANYVESRKSPIDNRQTRAEFQNSELNTDVVVVLGGDGPLITPDLISELVDYHVRDQNEVSLRSVELEDPRGYGRIVRDSAGNLVKIVEQKDGTPAELLIKEVNPSVWAFDLQFLVDNLPKVQNANAKGEIYLTDLVAMAAKKQAYPYLDALRLSSFNTIEELHKLELQVKENYGRSY
ncbi:MAG: NTP transferase domain-containing protein [Bifidobacteriaceae bacterium]|jgi:bifunctional N-acetylglucosamine-1-phosphate-uridyltransferase/glucosamine-1-phosphate-acetyltransferase GlmU-like protein|nr:NTP transferase domain-containing protein [Bifidobacteriaceae bacterium]